MKEAINTFRERIRTVRSHLGLSQEGFARKILVHPRTYQNIEAGKTERLEVKTLAALVDEGVDIVWLVTGQRQHPKSTDPDEVARLRAEIKQLLEEAEQNNKIHGDAIASRSRIYEEKENYRLENERLKRALMAGAVDKTALGLIREIGELLKLPDPGDIDQVLKTVAMGYRAAAKTTPAKPSEHEPAPKKSRAGGQKRRQANSS